MAHTVTVTRLPDETTDDVEYTIGGEHDHRCEAYRECEKVGHRHPKNENYEMEEWATKRVPQVHTWIDGMWMVPMVHRCGFDLAFQYENPEFQMTELGVYDVAVDWDGDDWLATLTKRPDPRGALS